LRAYSIVDIAKLQYILNKSSFDYKKNIEFAAKFDFIKQRCIKNMFYNIIFEFHFKSPDT